ncbi:MAG TPA: hypothetical protein VGE62_00790 [Candidatus Paceibacterota bacterium]
MTNSLEQISDKFQDLPEDAQAAIRQFEYDKALRAIHMKYKLHIDQAASLEKAVANVVFGEIRPQTLISIIQNELRLDAELAKQVAFDVNERILMPIQEIMRNIQRESAV